MLHLEPLLGLEVVHLACGRGRWLHRQRASRGLLGCVAADMAHISQADHQNHSTDADNNGKALLQVVLGRRLSRNGAALGLCRVDFAVFCHG